jgi:glycosyltransferase involved in cell wall biosynthesis
MGDDRLGTGGPFRGLRPALTPAREPADPAADGDSGRAATACNRRIAFVGSYPPRRCGIATFTRDLATAVCGADDGVQPMILALSEPGGEYEYPAEVSYEIRQAVKGDYARAAEFVNYSDVGLVSIQHEYGIFGGDDGGYVIDFLAALRVPAIATLHTVLKQPSPGQRNIVQIMARQCAELVVMSQVAADLLASSYGVSGANVRIVPHGIPEMAPRDRRALKASFGVPGRRMLLTFGLLGPNKGVETVIRALPALVAEFPDLVYFVVGATHPAVVRREGEAYRTTLEQEAESLGVRDHLVFRDQFVTSEELCRYLQATDVFVSPYQNEAQVTSGALSYAMGAGAAAVSTPYWHAQELLAEGRGLLFPFGDSAALGGAVARLFRSPAELERVRSAAFAFTRAMVWPRVGQTYLALARAAQRSREDKPAIPLTTRLHPRASSLPELRLDHMRRMTDDTGILEHATFTVPARQTGYCVDDNARALIVALESERLGSAPATARLLTTYLGYLHHAQTDDGQFRNRMSFDRSFPADRGSEDCLGRAIWALGATVRLAQDRGQRALARQMLERSLPRTGNLGPRGSATVILGLSNLLQALPDHQAGRTTLIELAERLILRHQQEADDGWSWFEPTLTYDNALIPLALFKAYGITRERATLRVACASLEFLETVCFPDGKLVLVGNDGWHRRGAVRAVADEQAIDASAFVLAFRGAYLATGDHHYLRRMRTSFAWFLGSNRLGQPLYDFATGGCRDGLGATEPNQNEGAESTLCFLMALLEMLELAGEGLEYPDRRAPTDN